jgi:hypothetical protein
VGSWPLAQQEREAHPLLRHRLFSEEPFPENKRASDQSCLRFDQIGVIDMYLRSSWCFLRLGSLRCLFRFGRWRPLLRRLNEIDRRPNVLKSRVTSNSLVVLQIF